SFDLCGVRCGPCVVPLPVCVAARARLHLDAIGHWRRTTQGRECTARRLARIGSGVRFWFLDSFRFVRRVGERGRNLPCPQSKPAGAPCWLVDRSFRLAPRWLAGEVHDSHRSVDWWPARRGGNRAHITCGTVRRMAEGRSLLLRLIDFSPRTLAHALAQSRCSLPQTRWPARRLQRILDGLRVRVWLDALYRTHSCGRPRDRRYSRDGRPGNFSAGLLLGGARDSVSGHGAWHRRFPAVLFEICAPSGP